MDIINKWWRENTGYGGEDDPQPSYPMREPARGIDETLDHLEKTSRREPTKKEEK